MLDVSDFVRARRHMVDTQIAGRGIRDQRILDAMREVPREAFVDEGFEEFSYEDSPLPIAEGQTISQPYVVAMMAEAGEVKPGDTVLEIGAGSGYAAAVFSRIASQVFAIERHRSLVATASARRELLSPRLERFVGVIYRPETELMSHYARATLPRQFDAFVWFDQTSALTPLGPQHARPGAPETYPFGL
jgi:protein-L-isoaspartate O-methyltransferase